MSSNLWKESSNDDGGIMEGSKGHANISSLAAESIFHDVDLLTEILLRLPSKSLMRFKSVCKSWRALVISRYFCLLWRQHHRSPGILLKSLICPQNRYVPISGPTAGLPQFEFAWDAKAFVLQSCNGFILHMKDFGMPNYWVYNPVTSEVIVLPRQFDACKIHSRRCYCRIRCPSLAFDSYSHGRVVALAVVDPRPFKRGFVYQVCVTENQGAWRISGKPFRSKRQLAGGVHWHNFVVWLSRSVTLFYDVEGEVLRWGAPPPGSMSSCLYHFGESGGHLHFIHEQGSRLIINEMRHDLSGWFVKHSIGLSQMEASLFRSIGWVDKIEKFKVNCLIEEKEDSTLVLGCEDDVVLYRIQDHKSWKLCEWEFTGKDDRYFPHSYFDKFVHQHVETISQFHEY